MNHLKTQLVLLVLSTVSLLTGAFGQLTPSGDSYGPAHSRLGLLTSRMKAQPTSNPSRQAQSPGSPDISFTFGMVDFPGQMETIAYGVNDKGEIVGAYGPELAGGGFLLKGTKFTEVNYPGSTYTEPNGMNDSGVIVGQYGTASNGEQGFELAGKTWTTIDYPGASLSTANAINKSGDIVGVWYCCGLAHGFLLAKGVFTSIDVPGAAYTNAFGINKTGEIVGQYGNSDGSAHGFLLQNCTFTTIDYPGGYSQNYLGGINNQGVIVGGYGEPMTVNGVIYYTQHAFIYQGGHFTNADVPFGPPAVTIPSALSNKGVIVGEYVDNSGTVYGYEATVGP